ncbi:HalD/BesD family halogenase [Trichormus azollae]|uniref:HalD/BesD family halogenase n=1 Tax=Trichormus azollae TaxID=1164 RepID=UPI00325DB0C3
MSIPLLDMESSFSINHSEDVSVQVDQLLRKHYFERGLFTENLLQDLAKSFQNEAYVKIPNFVPPVIETGVRGEVCNLLDQHALRRELFLKVTSNTPRFMENVRQADIKQKGKIIPAIYHSEALMFFLSMIVKDEVILCPFEQEKYLITRMTQSGDTHGWHWDDYSYSLVWFMEAPPPELGGTLELIPNTHWDKENPNVEYYLEHFPIQSRSHAKGDVYLIKADTTMHRVTPLRGNITRTIVNMAWANKGDLEKEISHETIIDMYDI